VLTFDSVPVTDPVATELLTEYFTAREMGFVGGDYIVNFPSPDRFVPPVGDFVIAREDGLAVGCGGIRSLSPLRFEVKHLYLRPESRGRGWGKQLLAELEQRAAGFGASEVVLDTNATLEAAGGLYRVSGYSSIEPYNDNPNATNWYRKALAS
jgi:GNAT superfamily N-acetyltransferase